MIDKWTFLEYNSDIDWLRCMIVTYNLTIYAEMVEWSITAVLKTVEMRVSGGSNPSLRATALEF